MTTFYIVRHAQSGGNAKIASDHVIGKGSELTEKGREQALKISNKFKNITFDAIFSSDFTRANQTAEIIALEHKLAVQATERLRERSLGIYFKKNPEKNREIVEENLLKIFKGLNDQAKMDYKISDDVESANEATSRFTTFLREIALEYNNKTILIVCHGNLIRTFLVHLGWTTYDELPKSSFKNTGYVTLESDGVDFFIKKVYGATKNKVGKRGW
jgi:broad specificity phosphatase PhoE